MVVMYPKNKLSTVLLQQFQLYVTMLQQHFTLTTSFWGTAQPCTSLSNLSISTENGLCVFTRVQG